MNLVEFAAKKQSVYFANNADFKTIFGVHLRKFWDNVTGFDVLKFDEFVGAGDRSTYEVVAERFGEDGVKMIKRLIAA